MGWQATVKELIDAETATTTFDYNDNVQLSLIQSANLAIILFVKAFFYGAFLVLNYSLPQRAPVRQAPSFAIQLRLSFAETSYGGQAGQVLIIVGGIFNPALF